MGKKKSFIDKSRAQTYSLIYRTAEEAAADPHGPDRIFVPTNDSFNAATGPSRPQPPLHPMAFREQSEPQLTDEQRREIIELGLPDDGYNYLQHMRTLAAPVKASIDLPTSSDDQTGPKKLDLELEEKVAVVENDAFVPPPEDKAVTDASKLTVFSLAENDEAAFQHYGGVTTLSKPVDRVRGPGMAELAELESHMAEVENADDGEEEDDLGDWLDSFVVVATQPQEHPQEADADDDGGDDSSAGDVDSDFHPDDLGEEGDVVSELPGRRRVLNVLDDGRSVVSTVYSRSERHDRSETQSQIDDRFEALALEYDDSDIGSLEDDEEHTRGAADASSFHRHLEEFRAKHLLKNGLPRATFATQLEELRQDGSCAVEDEAIAKARTKALAARLEDARGSHSRQRDEDLVQVVTSAPREQWDCESVVSLRSNLDNHPAVIGHGKPLSKRSTAPASASGVSDTPQALKLSRKTGLPLGFASTGGRVHKEEVEEASCSAHAATAAPASAASSHSQARVRGETKEEKAARKAAVKDAKREARLNKKQLKNMYRSETVRQLKQASVSGTASTIPIA